MAALRQRITQARKSRKLSQPNLAARLGITRTACSHWETGRAKPSTKHLEKVTKTLAVDALRLISGKKRRTVGSHPETDKLLGSDSTTVLLETQADYQATFDEETLKSPKRVFLSADARAS